MRKLWDVTERNSKRYWLAIIVLAVGNLVTLYIGLSAAASRTDELAAIVEQINNSRFENTVNVCLERNSKDQGIKDFILITVNRDKSNRLYVEAVKTFPGKIRGARQRCEAEARRKIRPTPPIVLEGA